MENDQRTNQQDSCEDKRIFSPLSFLEDDPGNDKFLSVLVGDVTTTGASERFSKLVRNVWNKSGIRACVGPGQKFLFTDSEEPMLPSNSSITQEPNEMFSEKDNEIFLHLETLIQQSPKDSRKFSKVIIFSDMNLPLFNLLIYMQSMLSCSQKCQHPRLLLSAVLGQSYVCVLPSGRHEMNIGQNYDGEWCGLIPLAGPATISTTGLHWNVTNSQMKFGELISSSNKLDGSGKVTITTDNSIVWTMDVAKYT